MKRWIVAVVIVSPLFAWPGSAAVEPSPYDDGATGGVFGNQIPSSGRMPLYDAFQKFCVGTHARAEAIERAVVMSGIRFHKRGLASTPNPMPVMDVTSWNMDFEGHNITINAGHAAEAYGPAMVRRSSNCSIVSWNRDETASVAALHKWAGLDPRAKRRNGLTLFEFETRGSAILPLNKDDAGRQAATEGRSWLVTIMENSVSLTHYAPPTPRS